MPLAWPGICREPSVCLVGASGLSSLSQCTGDWCVLRARRQGICYSTRHPSPLGGLSCHP